MMFYFNENDDYNDGKDIMEIEDHDATYGFHIENKFGKNINEKVKPEDLIDQKSTISME